MLKRITLLTVFLLTGAVYLEAACTGSSPSLSSTGDQASIQACVDMAVDGDTITITSSTVGSWATPVIVNDLQITIQGSTCTLDSDGRAQSCPIVLTGAGGFTPLQINTCSANDFVRLKNFEIRTVGAGVGSGLIWVQCTNAQGVPPINFAIENIIFNGDPTDSASYGGRWFVAYGSHGVIARSRFLAQTARGGGNVTCWFDNSISTSYMYHHSFSFGDQNALYFENNYFYSLGYPQGNGFTDNYICRIVGRFNKFVNNDIGLHGFDSGNRGVMTFEFYNNTFLAETGIRGIAMFTPRSGTGVVVGNTITNTDGGLLGYASFLTPIYYGAQAGKDLFSAGVWYRQRARAYYPATPWATFSGTVSNYLNADNNNLVTGVNPLDGNVAGAIATDSFGVPYHQDAATTRQCTDVVTNGTTTITSSDCDFTTATTATDDRNKIVISASFKRRVAIPGCTSDGTTTITCTGQTFVASDVGLQWSRDDRENIGAVETGTITAVSGGTTFTASGTTAACNAVTQSGDCNTTYDSFTIIFNDPYIASVTNESTAVMSQPAIDSGSGKTINIGYLDSGYPALDQPGYGNFATANSGNWPNVTTGYSAANYEALTPIYIANNTWNGGAPPAVAVNYPSTYAYMKANREWYDQIPAASFDGTVGTGYGELGSRPKTCTTGVGYWATDQGSWNATGADGLLYKCTATDTWSLYWTPLAYPHPLLGAVTLSSVTPDTGNQNTTTSVTLVGTAFDGGNFAVQVTPSTNITVNNIGGAGATTRTADFVIAAGAATGARDVTVSTDAGTSNAVTFTVLASAAPVLSSLLPAQGKVGATYSFAVTGTGFDGGNGTISESCTGISLNSISVVSATKITGNLVIASDAPIASCSITVTTDGGTSNAEIFTPQALAGGGYGVGRARGRR